MSFRFRPRIEYLENRETPSPIGGEPIDPNNAPPSDPPQSTEPPADTVAPTAPTGG